MSLFGAAGRDDEIVELLEKIDEKLGNGDDESGKLKTKVKDLKAQIEDYERQQRDLKHMVGLEKKRQEFEVEQAKRETVLKVKEENLANDKKRFQEQMTFHQERFEKEVGYLKELMGQILERLPTVTVKRVA